MRIIIADHQPAVRSALRLLLEQRLETVTVADAADGPALLDQLGLTRPDVVLLDWHLPGQSFAGLVTAIRERERPPKVIAMDAQPESERAALDAGADAFASKCDPPKRLLATVLGLWAEGRDER